MRDWVKTHATLFGGKWLNVDLGHRHMVSHLAWLATPLEGTIELPYDAKNHVSGLVDMVGGNTRIRRQSRAAIVFLESVGVISFEKSPGSCSLLVELPTWKVYQSADKTAERMRRYRQRLKENQALGTEPLRNGDVTVDERVTVTETSPLPLRGEEKRGEENPHSPPGDGLVLVTQPSTPAKPEKFAAEIAEVWAHWLAHWQRVRANGTPPKLTEKRKKLLRARRKEGYSVEQLKQAADGIWSDQHCLEGGFTQPETCYRDGGQVERYAGKSSSFRGCPAAPPADRPGMQRRKDLNDEQKHL